MHDFWVPAFRMKIDAVPGIDTSSASRRTRRRYPVVCAELCGLGHASMRQTAHVVEPAEFDAWLQERAQQAAGGGAARAAARGRGGEGEGSAATARPSSTAPGLRRLPRARRRRHDRRHRPGPRRGLAGKDEAFIEESIVDPAAEIAEGFQDGIMPPNYGDTLTPAELDAW